MIGGVHHIGMSSPDIDRLVAFYRDVIGFELVSEAGIPEPVEEVDTMLEMKGVTGRAVMMRTVTPISSSLSSSPPRASRMGQTGRSPIMAMLTSR